MGYEYDSKVNRDLARTAMSIYTKSHGIKSLNESTQSINEEVLRENINSLILNYVSDVIVLAEQELGREMTDVEINEASIELLNRINSISDEDKTNFVTQLAEDAASGMVAAPPTVTAGGGAGPAPAPSRPVGGGDISNFDPSNYDASTESVNQLFDDVAAGMYGDVSAGSLLSQVLASQQNQLGTNTRSVAQRSGAARRRLGEAVTARGTFANKSRPENRSGSNDGNPPPDPLDPANYGPGAFYDSGTFEGPAGIMQAIHDNLNLAGYSNSQVGQFAAQVLALHQ